MSLVARNEVLGCTNPQLDIYLTNSGTPINPAVLEYQIFDISTPALAATPLQVFPLVAGTRATADPTQDCPTGDRIATGRFAATWTVPPTESLGDHEIRWYYRENLATPEGTFSEVFEVSAIAASSVNLYVSVAEMRAVGVTVEMATDPALEASIRANQQFINRATRQWFNPRSLTLELDGNSTDTLLLPIPIISVSSMRINDSAYVLDPSSYRVYNGRDLPDDRQNPRIKLRRGDVNIFSNPGPPSRGLVFRKGRQNQHITGVFGYTEADGSTPDLIKRALTLLVVEKISNPVLGPPVGDPAAGPTGAVLRETTDGHTIQYTFVKYGDTRAGWSGYTMNREVHTILNLYKGPIGVAAPASGWFV